MVVWDVARGPRNTELDMDVDLRAVGRLTASVCVDAAQVTGVGHHIGGDPASTADFGSAHRGNGL